jgi:hypothetical protein
MKPHFVRNPEDLNLYLECFKRNSNDKKIENLKWVHFENVLKETKVCMLEDSNSEEDRIASIYAAMPVRFSVFGNDVKGAQSLDTLTDENYRGQGLFKKSATILYDELAQSNYKLVYGFPNDKSAFAFFNRLEWKELGAVPFLIKPLKFSFLLRSLTSKSYTNTIFSKVNLPFSRKRVDTKLDYEIALIKRFDSRYDKLWEDFSENIVGVKRNAEYLNWRLINKPNAKYFNFEASKEGELLGFVSFKIEEKHKVKMLYVMDLVFNRSLTSVGENLLKTALNQATKDGCEVCLAWNLPHSTNFSTFRKMNFFSLPKKFQFIKLFFGLRVFSSFNGDDKIYDVKNWYLSYLDSDTV